MLSLQDHCVLRYGTWLGSPVGLVWARVRHCLEQRCAGKEPSDRLPSSSSLCSALLSPPVSLAPLSELMANAFFDRALWNRTFSIALFVEHVLLETESQIPELSQLVTKHVFLLDKVSAGLQ